MYGEGFYRAILPPPHSMRPDILEIARNGNATVGTASVVVLAANRFRIGATFVNDSDTVIYLYKGDTAIANTGIRLNANGGAYEIGLNNLYRGKISAISSAASKNLVWTEQE